MFHRCANGLLVIPHTLRQVLPKKASVLQRRMQAFGAEADA
jgi:hypothetical protein